MISVYKKSCPNNGTFKEVKKVDELTKALGETLRDTGINLKRLAINTGIPYWTIYNSLGANGKSRSLRADEFMKICRVLMLNPWDFI